jgi:hypothetical protein
VPRFRPAPPIEVPLAALDGPAYDAELTKRATKWADELRAKSPGGRQSIALDYYTRVFWESGTVEMARAIEPPRRDGSYGRRTEAEQRKVDAATNRNVHATVISQLKICLRAQDVAAIWNDPDRMEAERIWSAYLHGVSSIAFTKGNKEADFVRGWRDLITARNDALEYAGDDDAEVRSIEARINRLTAPVKFPVLPEAAYEAAATLPAAERTEEIARLDHKYAAPAAATNGNGNGKTTIRKTRRLQAVATH